MYAHGRVSWGCAWSQVGRFDFLQDFWRRRVAAARYAKAKKSEDSEDEAADEPGLKEIATSFFNCNSNTDSVRGVHCSAMKSNRSKCWAASRLYLG